MSDRDYEVTREYHNHEFGFWLYPGDILDDGSLEPDLMAQLLSDGVLAEGVEFKTYEPEQEIFEEDE
jgi:hypothetical protein